MAYEGLFIQATNEAKLADRKIFFFKETKKISKHGVIIYWPFT